MRESAHRFGELFETGDIGHEAPTVAELACPDGEAKVLTHDFGKAADRLPCLAPEKSTVAEEHHETVVVSQRLVPLPMQVDPDAHVAGQFGRRLRVGLVVRLCEAALRVGFHDGHELAEEVARTYSVRIGDGEVLLAHHRGQCVVQVTGLEGATMSAAYDTHKCRMRCSEGVHTGFACGMTAVVEDVDQVRRIVLFHTALEAAFADVVAGGVEVATASWHVGASAAVARTPAMLSRRVRRYHQAKPTTHRL